MTERSVTHSTFAIERHYTASPARVFAAFATFDAKARWSDDPDYASDGGETEFDFRAGGRERVGGKAPDGTGYATTPCTTTSYPTGESCTATRCTRRARAPRCLWRPSS
jgi:uncharacterized protein YndB with AHSA1/START domain